MANTFSTNKARQGVARNRLRLVLIASVALAVLALAVIGFTLAP